ncbi:MAG: helix-turn-helix domain-containing protein [Clostridia bacterium]|nr:helix-turn-helix domain-containing protein [Clostridia bacterium]
MKYLCLDDIEPSIKDTSEYKNSRSHLRYHYNKRSYTHRLMCITGGSCTFISDGTVYNCEPGDMVYFPPNQLYGNEFSGNEFSVINIFFDFLPYRDDSRLYGRIINDSDFDPRSSGEAVHFQDNDFYNSIRFIRDFPEAISQTANICREFNERRICYRKRSNALLTSLLVSLVRFGDNSTNQNASQTADVILDYINRNARLPLTGKELSEVFNYHPNYINKLVQSATSMTLHQYVMDTKIRHAAELLRETDLSVTDIAIRYSFYDSSHFANVFRRFVGLPPMEYRKLNRHFNPGVTFD